MRILVTGGTGQLGRALVRLGKRQHDIVAPGSSDLDVSTFAQVQTAIRTHSPDVVIHAGAMTDVDGCEHDAERAHQINAIGSQNVAATTNEARIPILYVSTNFVFDGTLDRPYLEYDVPAPISAYGASKLAGELATRTLNPRHYIVRTAMVYDESGRNFVNTMLRLAESHPKLTVVSDQSGNPTYAVDLADGILSLIETGAHGTYHLTNAGAASWYEWACEIFETAGIDIEVEPIPASDFPRAATPPANGALANQAATLLGIELPGWRDALARCLTNRQDPR
jgi:dTDP-4-dehydrorhamnose reductase